MTFAEKKGSAQKIQALLSSYGGRRPQGSVWSASYAICTTSAIWMCAASSPSCCWNNIEGETATAALEQYLTDDMKKARKAALKFRGKNVRPEKPKAEALCGRYARFQKHAKR